MTKPRARTCPICGQPAGAGDLRPFCSARCRDEDLRRWMVGAYRIPGPAIGGDDDEDGDQQRARPGEDG